MASILPIATIPAAHGQNPDIKPLLAAIRETLDNLLKLGKSVSDRAISLTDWTSAFQRLTKGENDQFLNILRNFPTADGDGTTFDVLEHMEKLIGRLKKVMTKLFELAPPGTFDWLLRDLQLSQVNFKTFTVKINPMAVLAYVSALMLDIGGDLVLPWLTGNKELYPGQISPNMGLLMMCKSMVDTTSASHWQYSLMLYDFILKRAPHKITLSLIYFKYMNAGSLGYYMSNIIPTTFMAFGRFVPELTMKYLQDRQISKAIEACSMDMSPEVNACIIELSRVNNRLRTYQKVVDKAKHKRTLGKALEQKISADNDRLFNVTSRLARLYETMDPEKDATLREKVRILGGGILVSAYWIGFSIRSPPLLAGAISNGSTMIGQLTIGLKAIFVGVNDMRRIVEEKAAAILVTTTVVGGQLIDAGIKGIVRPFDNATRLILSSVLPNMFEFLAGTYMPKWVEHVVNALIRAYGKMRKHAEENSVTDAEELREVARSGFDEERAMEEGRVPQQQPEPEQATDFGYMTASEGTNASFQDDAREQVLRDHTIAVLDKTGTSALAMETIQEGIEDNSHEGKMVRRQLYPANEEPATAEEAEAAEAALDTVEAGVGSLTFKEPSDDEGDDDEEEA